VPGGYHHATEEEVTAHKEWILNTLDKWGVFQTTCFLSMCSSSRNVKQNDKYFAKFLSCSYVNTSMLQIYGRGYGGQIITTETVEETYKQMVVCKNEVNI
jgi:hypothetical protein